jgi:hypothetical protein
MRYPAALLAARRRAEADGTFRDRVRFDLVDRPHHSFSLLAAADLARFSGVDSIVAIEFGVAEGAGLLNLSDIANAVVEETGVGIEVVGFDSGMGLTAPVDYRDHPEIWAEGDFRVPDVDELREVLPAGTELIIGPVAETLPPFVDALQDRVVGFVSFDLDLYSSTTDALHIFDARPDQLLPVVISYFDDVLGGARRVGSLFRTEAAGQLLAIDEFNSEHRLRHVDRLRILPYRRPLDREPWLERMYAVHVLDHPVRTVRRSRPAMSMTDHATISDFAWSL